MNSPSLVRLGHIVLLLVALLAGGMRVGATPPSHTPLLTIAQYRIDTLKTRESETRKRKSHSMSLLPMPKRLERSPGEFYAAEGVRLYLPQGLEHSEWLAVRRLQALFREKSGFEPMLDRHGKRRPEDEPAIHLRYKSPVATEFLEKDGYSLAIKTMLAGGLLQNPLRSDMSGGCSGCGPSPFQGAPAWKFWGEASRRDVFRDAVIDNALFLGKWLLLAYMIEALMLTYIPAELIATVLGGDGLQPIALGALIGMPAYLNGYSAVPLVQALLTQGMVQGAAMAFVLAGGVSCIPAAVAVWALVKPRVFAAYLGIALAGSFIAGTIWSIVAM